MCTESFGSDAVNANGLDSLNNNFMLDGANNNDDVSRSRARSQARTPLEAIAEFQEITNQYDAEFGRTTGAIINAISKSGAKAFHGVAAGGTMGAASSARNRRQHHMGAATTLRIGVTCVRLTTTDSVTSIT